MKNIRLVSVLLSITLFISVLFAPVSCVSALAAEVAAEPVSAAVSSEAASAEEEMESVVAGAAEEQVGETDNNDEITEDASTEEDRDGSSVEEEQEGSEAENEQDPVYASGESMDEDTGDEELPAGPYGEDVTEEPDHDAVSDEAVDPEEPEQVMEMQPEEDSIDALEVEAAEESVSNDAVQGSLSALPDKLDLYVVEDQYADNLVLPNGYLSEYQCIVADAEYEVTNGESANVSDDGLITPAYEIWYWSGGYGHTWPTGAEGEYSTREPIYGTSTVLVSYGSESHTITVVVHDYAEEYARQVMDSYLKDNIRDGMSDLEKLEIITAFPAQYDYSVNAIGYVGLIAGDGGDCWASSSAIIYLCKKAGLTCHLRYGVNEPGAGSGHRNVAVQIGDQVYIAEAGFDGEAPRGYSVYSENTGFMYTVKNGGAKILQYDGFRSDITIPEYIDGYPVTSIAELAFYFGETYSGVPVNSLILPDTLQTLEKQSLECLEHLETITIPANVSSIGTLAFADCPNLSEINVAEENQWFRSEDGILFDKDMETLIVYPSNGPKAYNVPEGVTAIADYAFTYSYSHGVETLSLPTTLKRIGIGAFGDTSLTALFCSGNRPEFDDFALYDLEVTVYYPENDPSWGGIQDEGSTAYYADQVIWKPWKGNVFPTQAQQLTGTLSYTKTYGDDDFQLSISGLGDPKITYYSQDPDVVSVTEDGVVSVESIGSAVITAVSEPTEEYLSASVSVSITVNPKPISKCRLVFNRFGAIPFDSEEWEQCLTLADGDKALREYTDYWHSHSSWGGDGYGNLEYLEYTVTGRGNYTGTYTFSINPISEKPVLKSAALSGTEVTLSWQKETGTMGYLIYRKIGDKAYSLIKTISDEQVTTWKDTIPEKTTDAVSYRIRLYTMNGDERILSNSSYVKTVYPSVAPAATKVKRGDMFNLANNVKVTWTEVPGTKYYKVYREGVTDPSETVDEPVIVTTGLVGWDQSPGLTNGHAYRYRIVTSSTGKGDSSGDSPLSYSKLMYRLKTVVIRSVKNTGAGQVTVKYDKTISGDSYVLQWSEHEDMTDAKTKVVIGADNTSYVISGLKKGKTYYISIRVRKKVNGIDYYTTFGVAKKIKITQ